MKTQKIVDHLLHFRRWSLESLWDAMERFHDIQRHVPYHRFQKVRLLILFVAGLHFEQRENVNNAAQGDTDSMNMDTAFELIDKIAKISYNNERINEYKTRETER